MFQLLALLVTDCLSAQTPNPVVFLGGLGGSKLTASLHNLPRYRDCARNSDPYIIWVNENQLLTRFDCWWKNFQVCSNATYTVSNCPGVEIQPYEFGSVEGFTYLDTLGVVKYYEPMIEMLEGIGLKRNVSIRGAPYDFRLVGNSFYMREQYGKLQALIEQTYQINEFRPVVVISHSMGAPYFKFFLNTFVTNAWAQQYIKSHVTIAPAELGAPAALFSLISGPAYDFVPQFIPKVMVPILRTAPALLYMSPFQDADIWKDKILLYTDAKNYGVEDLPALWQLLASFNASYANSDHLVASYPEVTEVQAKTDIFPPTKTLCLFANDSKTVVSMKVPDLFTGKNAENMEVTMGDGTVPLESLRHCSKNPHSETIEYKYGGSLSAHTNLVQHPPLIQDVRNYMFKLMAEE